MTQALQIAGFSAVTWLMPETSGYYQPIVIARHLSMYLAKNLTNNSLKAIGNNFGGRDHSTVIHAVQTVNDMYDVDSRFRSSVDELKKKLKMKSI